MNKLLILVVLLIAITKQEDDPKTEMYYEKVNRNRFIKYDGLYEF